MSSLEQLLDEEVVARRLRVSVRTLRRWHALRKGPPRVKIGRKVHYRESSVNGWIAGSETCDA